MKTVCVKDLVREVADSKKLLIADTTVVVQALLEAITKHVKDGTRVRIRGLGTLRVKPRTARMAHNPKQPDSERVEIPAHCAVKFIPDGPLKMAVRRLPVHQDY